VLLDDMIFLVVGLGVRLVFVVPARSQRVLVVCNLVCCVLCVVCAEEERLSIRIRGELYVGFRCRKFV
jgi:hypothetical protein